MKKILAIVLMTSVLSFDATAIYLRTNDGANIKWEVHAYDSIANGAIADLLNKCNATQLSDVSTEGIWQEYWDGYFFDAWSTLFWLDGKNLTKPTPSFMDCSAQIADQMIHKSGWAPLAPIIGFNGLLCFLGVTAGIAVTAYVCLNGDAKGDDSNPIEQLGTGSSSDISLESVESDDSK